MATPYSEDVRQVVIFQVRRDGGHVKVRVRAGQQNSPGLCGELTMRPGEWLLLRAHLDADAVGKSQCQVKYEDGVQVWLADSGPIPMPIRSERVQEILDALNGLVVWEYETGTVLRAGRAVVESVPVGCDANLDKAIDWAFTWPEVMCTTGPYDGRATVALTDGTVLEWVPSELQWAVCVSETES